MAADRTKVQLLGPAILSLDGIDCGYISAPKLNLEFGEVNSLTAAYGETPLDKFHIWTKASLTVIFDEIGFQNYQKAIMAATRNTSGSDENISAGAFAGLRLTSMELVLTPRSSAIAATHALKAWRVVPKDNRVIDFGIESTQKLEVTFEFLIDDSKTDNEKLFRFGNVSVSADTSAPTVSTSSPLDGDTGVSVSSAKTTTFNEALNPATVNTGTVLCFLATETGAQAMVAGTVALDSTGLIVSFTPTSSLTGSTEYELVLTPGIKNASNIAYAGRKISFTTA